MPLRGDAPKRLLEGNDDSLCPVEKRARARPPASSTPSSSSAPGATSTSRSAWARSATPSAAACSPGSCTTIGLFFSGEKEEGGTKKDAFASVFNAWSHIDVRSVLVSPTELYRPSSACRQLRSRDIESATMKVVQFFRLTRRHGRTMCGVQRVTVRRPRLHRGVEIGIADRVKGVWRCRAFVARSKPMFPREIVSESRENVSRGGREGQKKTPCLSTKTVVRCSCALRCESQLSYIGPAQLADS